MKKYSKLITILVASLIGVTGYVGQQMMDIDDDIEDIPKPSGEIPYRSAGWNMVSLPYNTNLSDVIVTYNGTDYTWQEAVDNFIVSPKIYTYFENYEESDNFTVQFGYWMYWLEDNLRLSNGRILEVSMIYPDENGISSLDYYDIVIVYVKDWDYPTINCTADAINNAREMRFKFTN
jgi:hypothetical protein